MKPFMSVSEAVKVTGLSQRYIRDGIHAGTIPHVMSGKKYLVNIPALLRQLGVTEAVEEK